MFTAWFSVFLSLSFFFVFFVFFFFSKFLDAFHQTSTLYSICMIDICLFGREISDLVRVFGTSLRLILHSSVARGLFIRPVVIVVEGNARRIFVATTTSFAACGTKDSSVSHTTVIVRLFCPTDGHDDPTSSKILVGRSIRSSDVQVSANILLPWRLFRAVRRTGNEHDETSMGEIFRDSYCQFDAGQSSRRDVVTRAYNYNGIVAVYIRTTWSVLIFPVFPAGLSGMIGSSKCLRQWFRCTLVSIRSLVLDLSPGSRNQRLDSQRTERNADLWE